MNSPQVPKARGAGRSGPRRRTGCLTCRARKVRCDEGKPGCSNCDRLRLRCLYKPSITPDVGWGLSPTRPPNNTTASPNKTADLGVSGSGSCGAAAAASRSPDVNFFSTVLRADGHHTIPAPETTLRHLPTDRDPYPSEFDMLGFMGGITSELEQKHLDLTTGHTMAFTASPPSQSLPGTLTPGMDEGHFSADRRIPLTPDTSSSLIDGTSTGSASDVPTTRRSLSDAGGISYEDQLLQHFLTIDPPAAFFAPINIEWKYMRPALLAHARDSSPLLNALYCYADVHKAMMEGKRWRWAPTFYRVSSAEIQACIHGEVTESTLIKVFGAIFLLMISEVCSAWSRDRADAHIVPDSLISRNMYRNFLYSLRVPYSTTVP